LLLCRINSGDWGKAEPGWLTWPLEGAVARRGCRLPDAILHGKRSLRPRSRAVQRLAAAGVGCEAFELAWAGVCGTGLRTRSRHVCDFLSASSPLSAGSATAFDGALARCHGSRLLTLRLLFHHRPAVAFLPSPAFREVFTGPATTSCPPRPNAHFVPPFSVFPLADSAFCGNARVTRPC
jgi:hypothetical protein